MFENSKVIWSEGMFMRPQLFQQHDRYIENMINGRCRGPQPYDWGFDTLKIDNNLRKIGKIALKQCEGIFPDGTHFNLPEEDDLPVPLDIPKDIHDKLVFLALPVRRAEANQTDSDENPDSLARFRSGERKVRDDNGGAQEEVPIQIGKLKTRLLLQGAEQAGHTCLAVARIIETRADNTIVIDDKFIPANLNCLKNPQLSEFQRELEVGLKTLGDKHVRQIPRPGRGIVAENENFLLLQVINRLQPLFEHFSHIDGLHPEDFYRLAIQLAGELSTFFRSEKRPARLPPYNHDDLQATFSSLMDELRQLFRGRIDPTAIPLPLQGPEQGFYAAKIPDLSLLETANFFLAANAKVPPDTLRNEFPNEVKISPVEEIKQLRDAFITGIPIYTLPTGPRQIPDRPEFIFFEIKKHSEYWEKMATSDGFGIHVSGDFPGLELELWAIKEG